MAGASTRTAPACITSVGTMIIHDHIQSALVRSMLKEASDSGRMHCLRLNSGRDGDKAARRAQHCGRVVKMR